MTALQYFRLMAVEFAGVIDATVNTWITIATSDVYAPCLSAEDLERAKSLMAAHLMKLSSDAASGVAGTIKSEKEGDLSRTYGNLSNDGTLLGSTTYGQQYIALTSRCFGATIMTRM